MIPRFALANPSLVSRFKLCFAVSLTLPQWPNIPRHLTSDPRNVQTLPEGKVGKIVWILNENRRLRAAGRWKWVQGQPESETVQRLIR